MATDETRCLFKSVNRCENRRSNNGVFCRCHSQGEEAMRQYCMFLAERVCPKSTKQHRLLPLHIFPPNEDAINMMHLIRRGMTQLIEMYDKREVKSYRLKL